MMPFSECVIALSSIQSAAYDFVQVIIGPHHEHLQKLLVFQARPPGRQQHPRERYLVLELQVTALPHAGEGQRRVSEVLPTWAAGSGLDAEGNEKVIKIYLYFYKKYVKF